MPDFSVRAITPVQYLCIHRSHYMAAIRTTKMLRSHVFAGDDSKVNDHFDLELAKINTNTNRIVDGRLSNRKKITSVENEQWGTGSTKSLNHVPSMSSSKEFPVLTTRMKRSGSDAKDCSITLDPDLAQETNHHVSDQVREHGSSQKSGIDPDINLHVDSNKTFTSQTSFPFVPQLDQMNEGTDTPAVDVPSVEFEMKKPVGSDNRQGLGVQNTHTHTDPSHKNDRLGEMETQMQGAIAETDAMNGELDCESSQLLLSNQGQAKV